MKIKKEMRLKREKHLVMLWSLTGVTLCYIETEFTQRDDWSIPYSHYIHYNTDQDLYINKYLPFYSTYSFSFYRNEKSLAHDFTIHYIALWEDQKSEIIKRSIFYVQSITWRKNSETRYIGLLYRHIGVYFCSLPAWSFSVICRYSFECLFLSKSLLRSQINKYSFVRALLSNHLRQTSALTVSWCDLSLIIESVTSTQSKHTENFISSQFRLHADLHVAVTSCRVRSQRGMKQEVKTDNIPSNSTEQCHILTQWRNDSQTRGQEFCQWL